MKAANYVSFCVLIPLAGLAADDAEIDNRTAIVRSDEIRSEVYAAGGPEGYVKELARELSKGLPKKLDETTYLIGASAQGTRLMLRYRLPKVISKEEFEAASPKLVLNTTLELCLSPEGRVLTQEFDVTYRFLYVNKVGKSLFAFNVDKASCEKFSSTGKAFRY
jgi:hypothetical protein